MIPRSIRWAAVLLAAGGLTAQDRGAEAARTAYDELSAQYEKAQQSSTEKRRAITATEEYRKAREARDMEKIQELMAPAAIDMAGFIERFQANAEVFSGTDGALPFLFWLANRSGDAATIQAAIDTVLADHIASEKLVEIAEGPYWALRMSSPEAGLERLKTLADKSPHASVQAWSLYNLASYTRRAKRGDAEAARQADEYLARAEALAPEGSDLLLRIRGPQFERERLQIGMEAPDIAGEDLDGVPFKLSDYRGKVVVLDFWGDW